MKGSLYKWTNAIFGWQLKHVEIKDNEFRYYKTKGGKLQGIIPLTGCNIEMIANEPLRIVIQLSDSSVLYLKCQSVSDKVKWVNALSIAQHKGDTLKKQEELSLEELPSVKEKLASLFKSRILSNSAKLNGYVTQTWTLQGLLEAALSDFSEEFSKLGTTPNALKESAESIKRYTMEIKVLFTFT
jgi:hypothetical protein